MKKEVGILYKTVCDKCGREIGSMDIGTRCQVCKKDLCMGCQGTVWYAVYGDFWSEENFMICDDCKKNIPPELEDVIELINILRDRDKKSSKLYGLIEEKIRGVKKNG